MREADATQEGLFMIRQTAHYVAAGHPRQTDPKRPPKTGRTWDSLVPFCHGLPGWIRVLERGGAAS